MAKADALVVADAEAMRAAGERFAANLRAGDIVVLVGPLGAGKTTFTQGVAKGLGVTGPVTSSASAWRGDAAIWMPNRSTS